MLLVKSAVGQVLGSIVYALSDGVSNDYYLIDIGDFDAAKSLLSEDANVRGVFITHGHHDHILGLNKLKEVYPDCLVYASEDCKKMLVSAKANMSYYWDIPFVYDGDVTILNDGETIELFDNLWLTAIATPGHNPSCLSYQVGNYLFTGDSYIPNVKVVTNIPGGNKKLAKETVEHILEIAKDKLIMPGHNIDCVADDNKA